MDVSPFLQSKGEEKTNNVVASKTCCDSCSYLQHKDASVGKSSKLQLLQQFDG